MTTSRRSRHRSKPTHCNGWALLLAALICLPAFASPPDVVILDELENDYQPVPFDHKSHAQMAEMWNGCVTCHHHTPEPDAIPAATIDTHDSANAAKVPACKSCHPANAAADDVSVRQPSLKGAYHRQCLNCHKSWSGDNGCVMCHEPKNGSSRSLPTPDDIVGRMHPPLEAPVATTYRARYMPAAGPNVTFRHQQHIERYGLQCVHCHVRDTCNDCHSKDAVKAQRRKVVKPAMSWQQSHGPCMTCHQGQSCAHCHYSDDQQPPAPFDHRNTGQTLDADHADLTCVQCHTKFDFTVAPGCGGQDCHGQKLVRFPTDRPGPLTEMEVASIADTVASPIWASLRPRPIRPEAMRGPGIQPASPVRERQVATTQPPASRPVMPDAGDPSCVTAECHVAVKSFAHVHGPVGVNACAVCHTLVDEDKHTFTFARDGRELCTYCHEFDVSASPVVHEPAKRDECLGCHNPHGGASAALAREESIAAMCGRCHDQVTTGLTFLHAPVRDGDCTSCHPPHASRLPKLLDAAGTDLCLACHTTFGQELDAARFTHKGLEDQCDACHAPHGSTHAMSVKQAVPQLCYGCHEQTQKQVAQATVTHQGAVFQDRACLNCHTPHGGDLEALMRDLPRNACLECHDRVQTTADGRTVPAVVDVIDPTLTAHGPIRDGQCSGCHEPHGGQHTALLTKPYEMELFQPYSVEKYAFCFQCHDQKLVQPVASDADQPPATGFRNGSLNLHALHVNDRWGRACFACHGTHTAEGDKLIRAAMPFKKWQAPVGFRKAATGGFCAPGCHLPYSYDRENPVELASHVSRDAPAPVARSGQARSVAITANTLGGAPVTVPAPDRLSIVVVVRLDGQTPQRVLSPLAAAIPEDAPAQVVVIATGDSAARDAEAIAATARSGWSVVTDPADELSRSLSISAWPTIVVASERGVELARIAGTPVSLAIRLAGYLEALGREGDMRVQPPIASIVSNQATRTVEQYVHLVQQFQRQGSPSDVDKAQAILSEALKLHPDDATLRLARVGVLLDQDAAAFALAELETLDDTPAAKLLRARALMQLDRWREAQAVLEPLLAQRPDLRDGHFLMGQIHERFERWKDAAASYRRAQEPAPAGNAKPPQGKGP